jgi:hypothetical protein
LRRQYLAAWPVTVALRRLTSLTRATILECERRTSSLAILAHPFMEMPPPVVTTTCIPPDFLTTG